MSPGEQLVGWICVGSLRSAAKPKKRARSADLTLRWRGPGRVNINGVGDGGVGRSCVVDCTANVLHLAGGAEDLIPLELDLDLVRRQREIGIRGLGQVLKSFRDREVEFRVYGRHGALLEGLRCLDP